jgi:proliferating cell nuclear antigen
MNIEIKDNTKCEVFSTIFQHMKLFSETINIHFKTDSLSVQTMDNSHVSIIELLMPNTWFDTYEVEEDVVIGINTVLFFKVLGTREKGQVIHIEYDRDNTDKLQIRFNCELEKPSMLNKAFEIPLIDLDTDTMCIPVVDYEAELTLPSAHFAGLVNQLKLFGDSMDIQCSEEEIILHANSIDCGKMSVKIDIEQLNSFAIDEGVNMRISYSLNHLYNMVQYHKLSTNVDIFIKTDYPMKLRFNIQGDANTFIAMYLAPKIVDDY